MLKATLLVFQLVDAKVGYFISWVVVVFPRFPHSTVPKQSSHFSQGS